MKRIFSFFILATILLVTACVKDSSELNNNESVEVNFNINAGDFTRAYGDGTSVSDLEYAIFAKDDYSKPLFDNIKEGVFTPDALYTTLTERLPANREYSILLWADATNDNYTIDWATQTMTYDNSDNLLAQDESADAFFAKADFSTDKGIVDLEVQLTRPFAQLNFATTDIAEAETTLGYSISQTAIQANTYTKLNLLTGEASEQKLCTFGFADLPADDNQTLTVDETAYVRVAMCYLLVNSSENGEVTLYVNEEANAFSFTDITFGRNTRTNIIGNIFTNGGGEVVVENTTFKYTTSDDAALTINPNSTLTVVSNTYDPATGEGEIVFEGIITTLDDDTFSGCTTLESITIPECITTVEPGAFSGCSELEQFKGNFASEDGRYLYEDVTIIAFAPADQIEVSIPQDYCIIGERAFENCTKLQTIILDKSIYQVDSNAFNGCISLEYIYSIPAHVPTANPADNDTWLAFEGVACDGITTGIFVPAEEVDTYRNAPGWERYRPIIIGYDYVNGTIVEDYTDFDVKVMTWNICNAYEYIAVSGTNVGYPWSIRRAAIAQMIEDSDADVICLQELNCTDPINFFRDIMQLLNGVDPNSWTASWDGNYSSTTWPVETYNGSTYTGRLIKRGAYAANSSADEGDAIIYKTSKFTDVTSTYDTNSNSGYFWLSTTPNEESIYSSGGYTANHKRICLFKRLKHKETGHEFVVAGAHIDNSNSSTDITNGLPVMNGQVQILINNLRAKALTESEQRKYDDAANFDKFDRCPVIIVGDMNANPSHSPIKRFGYNIANGFRTTANPSGNTTADNDFADCYTVAKVANATMTYPTPTALRSTMVDITINSDGDASATQNSACFDYIFMRWGHSVKSYEIHRPTLETFTYYDDGITYNDVLLSDHNAVSAVINLRYYTE